MPRLSSNKTIPHPLDFPSRMKTSARSILPHSLNKSFRSCHWTLKGNYLEVDTFAINTCRPCSSEYPCRSGERRRGDLLRDGLRRGLFRGDLSLSSGFWSSLTWIVRPSKFVLSISLIQSLASAAFSNSTIPSPLLFPFEDKISAYTTSPTIVRRAMHAIVSKLQNYNRIPKTGKKLTFSKVIFEILPSGFKW